MYEKKKKKYMLSFFSAAVQFYVVTFSLARCVYTVNIRKSSNTKVTLHNAGSVHSNTSDVKDWTHSDPALQTPNMVHWYIHKHTLCIYDDSNMCTQTDSLQSRGTPYS